VKRYITEVQANELLILTKKAWIYNKKKPDLIRPRFSSAIPYIIQ
jgi:hypothetical protein